MCLLKVFSDTHSFKVFAANSPLPVYSVHDASDVRRVRTGETYGVFRISFDVTECDWDDFPGQVQDAIKFLTQYASEIRALMASHKATDAYLDFPIWSRLDSEIVNQNDRLPSQLVALCASTSLGIEMSQYARDAFESPSENAA